MSKTIKSSVKYVNVNEAVEAVSRVAENADSIDREVTPEYIAYSCEVSLRYATCMFQLWQGCGSPVAERVYSM